MEWTRSETLALAKHNCAHCHGAGLRFSLRGSITPCNCVLRTIFRICWDRWVRCATQERFLSRVSLEPHVGRSRPATWGRKDEEYIADFEIIARHTLEELEYRLFRYHFVLGASWKLCCRKLEIDRGNFFHAVYRIEQKLGRAFRETKPYPLFPLDEYFNGPSRIGPPRVTTLTEPANRPAALEFPVPVGKTA